MYFKLLFVLIKNDNAISVLKNLTHTSVWLKTYRDEQLIFIDKFFKTKF